MLSMLAFKRDFRTFKRGDLVKFPDPVTILVGDQGSGKSTLIELIRALGTPPTAREKLWQSVTLSQTEAGGIVAAFADGLLRIWARDFERDGVRNRTDIAPDEQGGLDLQLAAMRLSHGQSNRLILDELGRTTVTAPTLFLLDEPDSALSPRSCYALVRLFRKLASEGHQVIASLHSPIAIRGEIPEDPASGWKTVYDLETRQELPPEAYLKAQSAPPATTDPAERKPPHA